MNESKSTLNPGSSGTIVVADPGDDSKRAIGILKCKLVRGLPLKNQVMFEVQTFDFLSSTNYSIEEIFTTPKVIFEKNCEQINGRGHGGL